jgi:hypothetical protein
MSNVVDNEKYVQIFKAKVKQAVVIKNLGELLNTTLTYSNFTVNNKGIYLLQPDERGYQLFDISLNKNKFSFYKCTKDITFQINSSNFYKLLKNIKMKDSLTLTISENTEDEIMSLGICVEQPGSNNNKLTTNIRITPYHPALFEDLPTGYENPVVITGKEYQSTKNLQNTSEIIFITSKGEYIKFFAFDKDRHDRKLEVGNENDEESKNSKLYKASFNMNNITALCKCAGQSGSVQIYLHEELPLKITMTAGELGEISVYIKSREMIADEDDENYLEDHKQKFEEQVIEEIETEEASPLPQLEEKPIQKAKRGRQKKNV